MADEFLILTASGSIYWMVGERITCIKGSTDIQNCLLFGVGNTQEEANKSVDGSLSVKFGLKSAGSKLKPGKKLWINVQDALIKDAEYKVSNFSGIRIISTSVIKSVFRKIA